ncbi:DUF2190 family protein [Calidifontibacter sp. DB0510]|uniref:DUF2190 family protein n=1 Tax=Metallococcus carri TaxID=1656884 RepID=A0A967B1X0_9MICO|nr:capsid cement protein [Metallococcus carri]NHN55780.1 DUF2190 family protein [Metallococcus carri]NOP38531.1 DUF2190 family protein [Calidifontibacter sp. DB2511S]
MGEYVPKFTPGATRPRTASAAITGGQVVEITGPDQVGPASAGSTKWCGVAGFDVKAGERVTVYAGGVQFPIASGAVAAGDAVACAANGRVSKTTSSDGTVVGVAESSATDGQPVEIAFNR